MGLLDRFKRKPKARTYEAAKSTHRTADWITGGSSGNAELGPSMAAMRNRSRDACRNQRYARNAIHTLASYISGQRPQSNIKAGNGLTVEDAAKLNREVDETFKAWSKVCLTGSRLTFSGAQFQAVKAMFESGESFTRKRVRALSDGLPVPLQIEVLESDFVDHKVTKQIDTGWITNGIEFDAIGRRKLYHMFSAHPGDNTLTSLARLGETKGVPAASVAHLFPEILARPGQCRGEPWLSAVLLGLKDFEGYTDAERVRMRGAASFMATVENTEEYTFSGEDEEQPAGINPLRRADGTIVERISPGTIGYLANGQVIKFHSPPNTDAFKEYVNADLHGMAAGVGLPYELFSGDLSQTNFSSIMFGLGSFNSLASWIAKEVVIPLWAGPIWEWFTELGIAAGKLPKQAGPVKWIGKPFPLVDPLKQHKGNAIAVRNGAKRLEDWISEMGDDPEEVLADIVTLQKWARDNGIVLDAIPSTTGAGQTQQSDSLGNLAVDSI